MWVGVICVWEVTRPIQIRKYVISPATSYDDEDDDVQKRLFQLHQCFKCFSQRTSSPPDAHNTEDEDFDGIYDDDEDDDDETGDDDDLLKSASVIAKRQNGITVFLSLSILSRSIPKCLKFLSKTKDDLCE